jgi:hypothetical protein
MPHTVHVRPLVPHAPVLLPTTQPPAEQQPPLHAVWLAPPHDVEQVWFEVLQLCPDGQSAATLQPQLAPEMQRWPLGFDEQSTQAVPPLPQVPSPVPRLHVPAAQQPPLQFWPLPQLVVQVPVAAQARFALQSLEVLQPQAPPSAKGLHTLPTTAPLHDVHTAPPAPQAVVPRPLTHTPETEPVQQPWLHGCVALHAVVHTCAALQAMKLGQSAVELQPHAPATQAWPLPFDEQSTHRLPPLPQTVGTLPVLQLVPVQQPPHDVVLQTQLPPEHCWPTAHGLLPPHLQLPLVQLSARVELQATQVAPPVPQVANTDGLQVVPAQQPLHEVALHWQLPLRHCWPELHGALLPHLHVPSEAQVSPVRPQLVQLPPLMPQAAALLPATQPPLWQQPPLHAV